MVTKKLTLKTKNQGAMILSKTSLNGSHNLTLVQIA